VSSKRGIRRNHCGDKGKYSSRAEANDASYSLYRRSGMKTKPLDVYKCLWENHFHIGHAPKAPVKGKALKQYDEQKPSKKTIAKRVAKAEMLASTPSAIASRARAKEIEEKTHELFAPHSTALDAQLEELKKRMPELFQQ